VNKGICVTERSDPPVDRFDEAYIVGKTVDLVHGDDTYRIEIVRDLKHRGAARHPSRAADFNGRDGPIRALRQRFLGEVWVNERG